MPKINWTKAFERKRKIDKVKKSRRKANKKLSRRFLLKYNVKRKIKKAAICKTKAPAPYA